MCRTWLLLLGRGMLLLLTTSVGPTLWVTPAILGVASRAEAGIGIRLVVT